MRISPLVAEIVERVWAAGRLREGVGRGDVEIVLAIVGGLMDASVHIDPDLWRRYLAMVLDGIRGGQREDELPGESPGHPEVERILVGRIPPRRSQA